MASNKQQWEKDFPLAKLIIEGIKSLKGEHKQEQEQPLTYEEWQLKKRKEAGFLY